MSAYKALSDKHRRFVDEYFIDTNGAAAAIRAGYSKGRANVTAADLMARPDIRAAVEEKQAALSARTDITVDEVVAELAHTLRANVLDYMGITKGGDAYVDFSAMTREQASALGEITVDEYSEGRGEEARKIKRVRFKLNSKLAAADQLLKHLGGYAPAKIEDVTPKGEDRSVSTRDLAKALLGALSLEARSNDGSVGTQAQEPEDERVRPTGQPQVPDA